MMVELLFSHGGAKQTVATSAWVGLAIRGAIFGATLLVALLGRNQIAVFESLVGGLICFGCALVLPLVVYVVTFWGDMGGGMRTLVVVLVVVGGVLAVGVSV